MLTRRGFLGALVAVPLAALTLPSLAESIGAVNTWQWDGKVDMANAFAAGDAFTIEGVYAINPKDYRSTGSLQRFVVTGSTADCVTMRPVIA